MLSRKHRVSSWSSSSTSETYQQSICAVPVLDQQEKSPSLHPFLNEASLEPRHAGVSRSEEILGHEWPLRVHFLHTVFQRLS